MANSIRFEIREIKSIILKIEQILSSPEGLLAMSEATFGFHNRAERVIAITSNE